MNDFVFGVFVGGGVCGLIVFMLMTEMLRRALRDLEDQEKAARHAASEVGWWMRHYFDARYPAAQAEEIPAAPAASEPVQDHPFQGDAAPREAAVLTLPVQRFISYIPGRAAGRA